MKVCIVMGTGASGKTYFIEKHFPNYAHLSVGEYQEKLKKECGNPESLEMGQYYRLLKKANEQIEKDLLKLISERKDVVLEHTLFKAKRRVDCMEEIRRLTDVPVDIYVMQPSDERLRENIRLAGSLDENTFEHMKSEMEKIEFPNPAEGFAHIYEVCDDVIRERMEEYDETLIERAKSELEAERTEEIKKEKREKFLKELEHKRFWHYCEGCGKKELLTPDEAYEQGWDYPPRMGFWGVLGPRTCGECGIDKTLYWKIAVARKNNEELGELSKNEKETLGRILGEPLSVLLEEDVEEYRKRLL